MEEVKAQTNVCTACMALPSNAVPLFFSFLCVFSFLSFFCVCRFACHCLVLKEEVSERGYLSPL